MKPYPFASLQDYALSVVELQAEPPRSVRLTDLLAVALHLKDMRRFAYYGAISILLGIAEWLWPFSITKSAVDIIAAAFFLLVGLFLVCLPFLLLNQWLALLRSGANLRGNVTQVSYTPPGRSRDPVDRANGVATGTIALNLNGLPMRREFRINNQWAGSIHVGSCVQVLATPKAMEPLNLCEERPDPSW